MLNAKVLCFYSAYKSLWSVTSWGYKTSQTSVEVDVEIPSIVMISTIPIVDSSDMPSSDSPWTPIFPPILQIPVSDGDKLDLSQGGT